MAKLVCVPAIGPSREEEDLELLYGGAIDL